MPFPSPSATTTLIYCHPASYPPPGPVTTPATTSPWRCRDMNVPPQPPRPPPFVLLQLYSPTTTLQQSRRRDMNVPQPSKPPQPPFVASATTLQRSLQHHPAATVTLNTTRGYPLAHPLCNPQVGQILYLPKSASSLASMSQSWLLLLKYPVSTTLASLR